MPLILETTSVTDVLEDFGALPLPADMLGLLCEARLSGLSWRELITHLSEADLDALGCIVLFGSSL